MKVHWYIFQWFPKYFNEWVKSERNFNLIYEFLMRGYTLGEPKWFLFDKEYWYQNKGLYVPIYCIVDKNDKESLYNLFKHV